MGGPTLTNPKNPNRGFRGWTPQAVLAEKQGTNILQSLSVSTAWQVTAIRLSVWAAKAVVQHV